MANFQAFWCMGSNIKSGRMYIYNIDIFPLITIIRGLAPLASIIGYSQVSVIKMEGGRNNGTLR